MKEVLPPQYQKRKWIATLEKDIILEHRKLVNLSEVNAKYRYIQLCRSLKTYGITFFSVKVALSNIIHRRGKHLISTQ